MTYRDAEKRREANRKAAQRRRDKAKCDAVEEALGMTQGITIEGMTGQGMTVTPEGPKKQVPVNYGQPDCECRHCGNVRRSKSGHTLNHGPYKTAGQLGKGEFNRVSLPGDVDYAGVGGRPEYAHLLKETA